MLAGIFSWLARYFKVGTYPAKKITTCHKNSPPTPSLCRRHKRCPPARRQMMTTTSMFRATCPCLTSRHWPGTYRTRRLTVSQRSDDGDAALPGVFRDERARRQKSMGVAQEGLPPPRGWPPKAPALGPSFYEGVPQAEPGVFGRRRVCRRRRPEDPPQVGLGVYRRRRQPGRRCGE